MLPPTNVNEIFLIVLAKTFWHRLTIIRENDVSRTYDTLERFEIRVRPILATEFKSNLLGFVFHFDLLSSFPLLTFSPFILLLLLLLLLLLPPPRQNKYFTKIENSGSLEGEINQERVETCSGSLRQSWIWVGIQRYLTKSDGIQWYPTASNGIERYRTKSDGIQQYLARASFINAGQLIFTIWLALNVSLILMNYLARALKP